MFNFLQSIFQINEFSYNQVNTFSSESFLIWDGDSHQLFLLDFFHNGLLPLWYVWDRSWFAVSPLVRFPVNNGHYSWFLLFWINLQIFAVIKLSNLMYRFVATCFIKVIVSNTSNIIQKFQFVPFLNSYTSISSWNIIAKFMKN